MRPQAKCPRRVKLPASLRLARSGLHGRGVFARDFIPEGEQIIEYIGERITKDEARRREDRRVARAARGGAASVFIFELNRVFDLDGDVAGNPARWINHSCEPNCEAQEDCGRIWIVALRDIAPGEELTFDYGFPYDEGLRHPCRCGAAECAGFIVARPHRWRVRRWKKSSSSRPRK